MDSEKLMTYLLNCIDWIGEHLVDDDLSIFLAREIGMEDEEVEKILNGQGFSYIWKI